MPKYKPETFITRTLVPRASRLVIALSALTISADRLNKQVSKHLPETDVAGLSVAALTGMVNAQNALADAVILANRRVEVESAKVQAAKDERAAKKAERAAKAVERAEKKAVREAAKAEKDAAKQQAAQQAPINPPAETVEEMVAGAFADEQQPPAIEAQPTEVPSNITGSEQVSA